MFGSKITIDNFRDMGGLTTADGRTFKEGKLFRTAALSPKTKADKYFIDGLGLDAILDFRTETEISEAPDYVPEGVEYIHASVLDRPEHSALIFSSESKLALLKATPEQMQNLKNMVSSTYEYMPFATEQYKKLFALLDEGKTFAFHCTAGKDRTGIAAAFIELNLGRTVEQAKEEYMLSNAYRADTNEKIRRILTLFHAPKHAIDGCMYALTNHAENFDLAISTMLQKHTDLTEFFREEYGVTPERVALWKSYYLN